MLVGISLCDGHRRDAGMKVPTAGNTTPGDEILHGDAYYLWALSMEQASCDPAGAYSFDVASILKKMCNAGLPSIQGRQDSSDTKPQKNTNKQQSSCSQNLVLTYRKIVRFTAHIHTPRVQDHFNIILSNAPRTQMLLLHASFHAFPTSTMLTTCPSQTVSQRLGTKWVR